MPSIRRQNGVAVLAMVAVLVMAVLAGIMSLVHSALSRPATSRHQNAAVLQQAKDALIGYVVKEVMDLSNATPGQLPCPEAPGDAGTSLEGRASGSCSAPTSIGRLPWRTLGLDKLVDAASEPLWYAVSPTWAGSGVTKINSGTPGDLSVDGVADVVAVIIAPGPAFTISPTSAQQLVPYSCGAKTQFRNDRSHVPTGGNPDVTNYLECANATVPPGDVRMGSTIVGNDTNPVLNDQLVYITAKDILNAIQGPVAERMQKTVAPLFKEFSERWPSGTFLPYAATFIAPENSGVSQALLCGPAAPTTQVREGLLPLAPAATSGTCASAWTNVTMTGTSNVTFPSGITCPVTSGTAECTFRYYQLTPFGQSLGWLLPAISPGGTTATVTIQATSAHGAATFREPITDASVTVNPSAGVTKTPPTTAPLTNGNAQLTLQVQATSDVCRNGSVVILFVTFNFLCSTVNSILSFLGADLVSDRDVTVSFPSMSSPVLNGTYLSAQVATAAPGPHNLVAPATSAAHYWFMQNEWYRYTYYAVSANASAAATGGNLTVSGFPSQFGAENDKRFVLALMGPPVAGQTRSATAGLEQYLEGQNANLSRTAFPYQVFASSGNDRIAACPFTAGSAVICN
jgi:hypothetical protein